MTNHAYFILIILVATVLPLLSYLFGRDQNIIDVKNRLFIEASYDKVELLRERLRTAQIQIKRMRKSIDSNRKLPDCEVIHIAVVCIDHAAVRDVVFLIKSILFSRKHPLHFHFISNTSATKILTYMIKTWGIPSVMVSYYSTEKIQNQTNLEHWDAVDKNNLYKLLLPMILPDKYDKMVILDPDIIVNMDIAELWKLSDTLKDEKAIAAVENQNNWYIERLKKYQTDWTVLGKGINLGVLLYGLNALRKLDFSLKVIQILRNSSLHKGLIYQDIFNVVLEKYASIFQFLHYKWNLQLSENSNIDFCDSDIISELKIVQINSLNNLKNGCIAVLRKLQNSFLELSGNLLKRELSGCKSSITVNKKLRYLTNESDDCINFRIQQNNIFRTHLYFIEYDYEPKPNDVTLVTQMTIERLDIFQQMCKHWEGPISIAIHLTEIEAYEFLTYVKSSFLKTRTNIGYHIVYKEGTTGLYPYNYLRNVALENVRTPYVFLSDIDFLPVAGMYQRLRDNVLKNNNINKKALVVPAFEQTQFDLKFPKNKESLLMQMDKKQIVPFKYYIFPKGHNATNYPKWKQATTPYKVEYQAYYEPYMILPKDIPKYDERFVGWGWDKTSHTIELDADGYEFWVLPDLYILHMSHTKTYHRTMFYADKKYFRCVRYFRDEFLNHFTKKYGQRGEFYKRLFVDI